MSGEARVRLTTGQAVVRWLHAQYSERDGAVRRAVPAILGLFGAATATANRLPVLLLASDTFANRRQGPVRQQLEHPVGSGAFWDLGFPEVAARAETEALSEAHRERARAQRHY